MSNTSSRRVVGILDSFLEVNCVLLRRGAPLVGAAGRGRDGAGCVMSGGTLTPMKRSSRLAAELGGGFRLGLDLLGHSV
jgi:hypothetical protein